MLFLPASWRGCRRHRWSCFPLSYVWSYRWCDLNGLLCQIMFVESNSSFFTANKTRARTKWIMSDLEVFKVIILEETCRRCYSWTVFWKYSTAEQHSNKFKILVLPPQFVITENYWTTTRASSHCGRLVKFTQFPLKNKFRISRLKLEIQVWKWVKLMPMATLMIKIQISQRTQPKNCPKNITSN